MEQYAEENKTLLHPVMIALIRGYAALYFYGKVPSGKEALSFQKKLSEIYEELCIRRNPRWEKERFIFGIYLATMKLDASATGK